MTHAEKLQQIFDAALKDCSDINKPLKRAFPSSLGATTVAASQPLPETVAISEAAVKAPAKLFVAPVAPASPAAPAAPAPPAAPTAAPAANAGLSQSESAELGRLLEEQQQRKTRKRRREMLTTLAVVLALTGGGSGWFVQSPQRVQAMKEAIRDIRSVGDVKSMVAKYQVALDKIAVRSKQIDQATESMGVSSDQDGAKDPNMDAEMLAMMGGKGRTTGQRNQMVQKAFGGDKKNEAAKDPEFTAALPTDGSYR